MLTTWEQFYEAHKKGKYTPVFNSFLETQMTDARVPLLMRALAWTIRNSWGRFSDTPVDSAGGRAGQIDCARDLGVLTKKQEPDRRRIHRTFQELIRIGLIGANGREIWPVDPSSPFVPGLSHPNATNSEEKAKTTVDDYLENVWKLEKPTAYAAYQTAEEEYKKLRTELVEDFKAAKNVSQRGATNDPDCRIGAEQNVALGSDIESQRGATNEPPSFKSSKPVNVWPSSSFRMVRAALKPFVKVIDDDALKALVAACQKQTEDATPEEVCHFIAIKGGLLNPDKVRNPLKWLSEAVAKCFEPETIADYRQEEAKHAQAQDAWAAQQDAERQRDLAKLRAELNDPRTPAKERAEIQRMLDILERKPAASEGKSTAAKADQA